MASSDYFTLTDFEVFRGVTPDSTTSPNEDQVQKYIDLAVSQFEQEVGIYRSQTNVTETVFANNKGLYLSNVPITSITSIKPSDGDVFNPTWQDALDTEDYRIMSANAGRILLRSPIVTREYQVVYDSGYSYIDMPNTIKEVIYLMVMYRIFQFHLFDSNLGSNTTKIVDVDVYKEITKGGDPFTGFSAMDVAISNAKANVKGSLKTFIKW